MAFVVHSSPATVACVLNDPRTLARVLFALRREGGHGVALSQTAVLAGSATRTMRALIYDMVSHGRDAVDFVRRVHGARPDWPVWLYYVPRPGVIGRVGDVVTLRGVWATPQMTGPAQDADAGLHARRLMTALPRTRLLGVLDPLLRSLPLPVRTFLESSLEPTDLSATSRHSVRDASAALPHTQRHLERLCQDAGLLAPKKLLDRMTLVFIAFQGLVFDVPLDQAAQHAGLEPRALRELHHRVLGSDARWAELAPQSQFDFALIALARACNVSPGVAEQIVQRAAEERRA
jgi:hypothetical protein